MGGEVKSHGTQWAWERRGSGPLGGKASSSWWSRALRGQLLDSADVTGPPRPAGPDCAPAARPGAAVGSGRCGRELQLEAKASGGASLGFGASIPSSPPSPAGPGAARATTPISHLGQKQGKTRPARNGATHVYTLLSGQWGQAAQEGVAKNRQHVPLGR